MESSFEIRSVFWIGTFVMLFLAFSLLFLAFAYQRHFTRMKHKEAELRLRAVLESEKRERQRIASDLHDSVQGDLNAIRNYFVLLVRSIPDYDNKELLEAIREALDQTTENTQQISYKLMPPLLEGKGFVAAVGSHFEQLSKATGKNFSIQSGTELLSLTSDVAYELFRVVQELTQNMLKYGEISACTLSAYRDSDGVHIEIVDDGTAFNFKASQGHSQGLGLRSIHTRLTLIGAELVQLEVLSGNHFVIHIKQKS